MRNFTYVFTITLFFFQANSWGKLQEFKNGNESYHVEVPEEWTSIPNTLDIPVNVVSKLSPKGSRAVVSVVPLEKDDGSFKKLDKSQDEYVRQKEEWLEGMDGTALSWDNYHEEKLGGNTIYSIGFTYECDHGTFHDRTYYVVTKSKKMFYLKTTVPTELEASQNKNVNEVVRSIASVE